MPALDHSTSLLARQLADSLLASMQEHEPCEADVSAPVAERPVVSETVSPEVVPRDPSPSHRPFVPLDSIEELLASLRRTHRDTRVRVLHVFSGLANRPGSLGRAVRDLGGACIEVDILNGEHHDVLDNRLADALIAAVVEGQFDAVMMGTPCNTFSVARMHDDGGPRQLRGEGFHHGSDSFGYWDCMAVWQSDQFVWLTIRLATAARVAKAHWVIENPPHRGEGSERYQATFRGHVSLFDLDWMLPIMQQPETRVVRFCQCAFGGRFQKWSQFAYSSSLTQQLAPWKAYTCSHCFQGHEGVAIGADSRDSASYPEAMAWTLAQVLTQQQTQEQCQSAPNFRSGSAQPHADDELAVQAVHAAAPTTSASLRRLEPEREEVLVDEPFPAVNVPVQDSWEDPPPSRGDVPAPRTTNQLIPLGMQRQLRAHATRTRACYEAASRGRWRWARDHRPDPLTASEEACLCPDVPRGWSWVKRDHEDVWDPAEASSWPDDPPDAELNAAAILGYALEHGFTDMRVIAWMCHGYPGPDMEHHAVIGTPHVGALRDYEALVKCASKDRKRKWGSYGHDLPPVWPALCDPVNITWRNGKPRMTIDKTMQLTALYEAYNAHIRLDQEPTIDYVSVGLAGRSSAILLTAGMSVKLWGFDIDAYFRKSGKQRLHWWMSGLLYWDGYGHDPRVQFGQREAPVRLGRQSTFLRFAMHREMSRLDKAYPPRDDRLVKWLAHRAGLAAEHGAPETTYAALFYVMLFVDDAAGGTIDDPLYDHRGQPILAEKDGKLAHVGRADMYLDACLKILEYFGHGESVGKTVRPSLERDFLGVTESLATRLLFLTKVKKSAYAQSCTDALEGAQTYQRGVVVQYPALNSLVHKLLHAASLIVLGRQHLWHLKQALRVGRNGLRSGACLLHGGAQSELRWWVHRLSQQEEEGVPLASRSTFPSSGDPAVLDSYSDASRELKSASSSGLGAWCVVDGVFLFVERRWTDHERKSYSINVLEYAAMNIGSFTFISAAKRMGRPIEHVREHVDNSAAEMVAERGRPRTWEMHVLTQRRYHRLVREQVTSAVFRVASVDNDVADGLSRGGTKLADAIRMAVQAGLTVRRLEPDPQENDLKAVLDAVSIA